VDATGAAAGQALTFDGTNVVWGTPAVTLALPYSGSTASGSAAFGVTNTGASSAGSFAISNNANAANALDATTDGSGFAASFTGTGGSSNGVYVNAAAGQTGLQVNAGRVIVSYDDNTIAPPGAGSTINIPDGSAVVVIRAGATTGGFNVNLPNG